MPNPEQTRASYPYKDGDVTVLGPEVFVSDDETVICWRGENYYRRSPSELERFAERVAGELEAKATGIVALTGRSGPKSDAFREAASLIRNSAKGEG